MNKYSKKLCVDCVYHNAGLCSVSKNDKKFTEPSLVDGEIPRYTSSDMIRCSHQRKFMWLDAYMLGRCGTMGRFFIPKNLFNSENENES